jgi:hypothetical protein
VWSGTLFECTESEDEIILRYSQFLNESAVTRECNNGAVVAQSIGIEMDTNSSQKCYSSHLNISTNMGMSNKTVLCAHVDGMDISVIDTSTITFITGIIT